MHDGIMEIVLHHQAKINTEKQYPYTSGGGTSAGTCRAKPASAVDTGIKGYVNITVGSEEALKQAAAQHAVISIGIDASQMSFQFYSQGVYDEPSCHNKVILRAAPNSITSCMCTCVRKDPRVIVMGVFRHEQHA